MVTERPRDVPNTFVQSPCHRTEDVAVDLPDMRACRVLQEAFGRFQGRVRRLIRPVRTSIFCAAPRLQPQPDVTGSSSSGGLQVDEEGRGNFAAGVPANVAHRLVRVDVGGVGAVVQQRPQQRLPVGVLGVLK